MGSSAAHEAGFEALFGAIGPWKGIFQAALKDFGGGIEEAELAHPVGVVLTGGAGDKTDDFAFREGGFVASGERRNAGVDTGDGRDLEVRDVHGELGAAVYQDSESFDAFETACRGTNILSDGAGDGDIRGIEEDVVSDEEFTRSDGGGSSGGMEGGTAEIRAARGIFADGVAQAFELAFADVFEVGAVGARGGSFIEIDGDAETTPYLHAGLTGEECA